MLAVVEPLLSIGEFSKATYLSVKALRHYHDVGLLQPAVIDPSSGYRQYAPGQIATAQAIRRFRDLDMPIDDVRQVLEAPDEPTRNRTILAHLERMQQQLEQTQATVASLQSLLGGGIHPAGPITIRRVPAIPVVSISASLPFDDSGLWLEPALVELREVATAAGLVVVGPDGALFSDEFFEEGEGEVTAFLPVDGDADIVVALPAVTVAVLLHDGPSADLDQAYGALGAVVAEQGIGGPGPVREHYLTPTSTEVCWPVTTGAHP